MKVYLCICVGVNTGDLTIDAFLGRDKAEKQLKEIMECPDFRMNYNEVYLEELDVIE